MNETAPPRAAISRRPASADDQSFLYQLYCSTRRDELTAYGIAPAQQEMFLKLQFTARQRHYEIAYTGADHQIVLCNNQPIGRILVYRSASEIRLVDIELLTEWRGKGYGAALVQGLLDEAQAAGKPVTLHVDKFNRAARLYERLGFTICGDIGSDYKMEWRPEP